MSRSRLFWVKLGLESNEKIDYLGDEEGAGCSLIIKRMVK